MKLGIYYRAYKQDYKKLYMQKNMYKFVMQCRGERSEHKNLLGLIYFWPWGLQPSRIVAVRLQASV